jgi:hypothetical protein
MNRKRFFDAVRPMMPGGKLTQDQVDRIEAVVDGLEASNLSLRSRAYVLATAHHEADYWRALEEYASGSAYEGRRDLGNTQPGDGKRFKGRGLVMITGRSNYTDWSRRLNVDFVGNPQWVSDLEYAVPILIDGMTLGTFTGKKLHDYFTDTKTDWVNARRTVNGLDRADLIASHALKFLAAIDQ